MFTNSFVSKVCVVIVCVLVALPELVFAQAVEPANNSPAENVHVASGFNYFSEEVLQEPGQEIETTYATKILDFENFNNWADVTNFYNKLGVTILGARIVTQGVSLNTPHYEPKSGLNVLVDLLAPWQGITFAFSNPESKVYRFGFFYTAGYSLSVKVFDSNNQLLRQDFLNGPNFFPKGTPNKKYEIFTQSSIMRVEVSTIRFDDKFKGVNSFTLDDVFFDRDVYCESEVTKIFQNDPLWANDHYGELSWNGFNGFAPTIKNWGCALTAVTMMLNQQSSKNGQRETTPAELNQWLQNNSGYSGGFISFVRVSEFAKEILGLDIEFVRDTTKVDDQRIKSELCTANTVVMEVQSGRGQHFVLGTGFNHLGYLMNDPISKEDQLLKLYPKGPTSIRYFAPIKNNQSFELISSGDVSLRIVDPSGRELSVGFDSNSSRSGYVVSKIRSGSIFVESITAEGSEGATIYGTRAMIQYLMTGVYTIEFVAAKNSSFQAQVNTSSPNGVSQYILDHQLDAGKTYSMQLNFKRADKYSGDLGYSVFTDFEEKTFKSYLPFVAN